MRNRGRRGNAVIEFAVGSSFLILLFSGAFQFGYTFYVYENVLSAVRGGARYGSVSVYRLSVPTVDSAPASAFTTQVRNVTVYGNPEGTGLPVAPGLLSEHVDVDVEFANNMPSRVSVSIRDYEVNALFGRWRAQNKPFSTFLYTGRYAPPLP